MDSSRRLKLLLITIVNSQPLPYMFLVVMRGKGVVVTSQFECIFVLCSWKLNEVQRQFYYQKSDILIYKNYLINLVMH